ncbi:MAG: thioredoxin family protein [Victivallaceae bacterium]|nr:thioredoxin family protein [Victivallaceae bacterium]
MKKFFGLLAMLLAGSSLLAAGAQKGGWFTDHDKAMAAAKTENRPVLILFTGSDWCPYCIKLEKETLSGRDFKHFAKDNLVLLKLDFPRNGKVSAAQRKLAREFKANGYPTTVIVSPDGKELGRMGGYLPASSYMSELKNAVKKHTAEK